MKKINKQKALAKALESINNVPRFAMLELAKTRPFLCAAFVINTLGTKSQQDECIAALNESMEWAEKVKDEDAKNALTLALDIVKSN